jgi:hypothetical protein
MSNGRTNRQSIFGALLFLVLGSVLLWSNFHPEFPLLELIDRYWPVVLILWGAAKLVDYAVARAHGEPAAPSFTAGEFFLLLLILACGVSVSGLKWLDARSGDIFIDEEFGFGHSYSFPLSESVAQVRPDSRLNIELTRGSVTLLPEDISEIRITGMKTVRTLGDEEDAKKRSEDAQLVLRESAGGYEIRQENRGRSSGRVTLELQVHVPKKLNVQASLTRGDLKVAGLDGQVTAQMVRGDADVRDTTRDVNVEVRSGETRISGVKGNVRISGRGGQIEVRDVEGEASTEGEFSGPIRYVNVAKGGRFRSARTDLTIGPLSGRMEMRLGGLQLSDVRGNVTLTSMNKDIRMENVAGRIQVQNRRGDIEVRYTQPPKEEIEITNESGRVSLYLPSNSAFEIAASSKNGEVSTDFRDPLLKLSGNGDSNRLDGKVGAKGPKIMLNTTYGEISLRTGVPAKD